MRVKDVWMKQVDVARARDCALKPDRVDQGDRPELFLIGSEDGRESLSIGQPAE